MKNPVIALGVLVVVILFGSCKKDESSTNPVNNNIVASGTVKTFGGQAITNAAIAMFAGNTTSGTPAATGTSNSSGQWQLTAPAAGKYTLVVSAAGYPTSHVMANLQASANIGTTILAEQTINGLINDAQTGTPLPNATVRFFAGSNNDTTGYSFPSMTTDIQGRYTTTLTLGSYVYAVFAPGRVPLVANATVSDTTATQMVTTVTQPVPVGQMRIVLNWGALPYDLDSHLTGDSTTATGHPRYHVYYANRVVRTASGDTIAYLDVDDVTSYGPETITIFRFFPGTLRYKIHDYSNLGVTGSHYMSDSSSAVVRVYTSAGLVREDHILRNTAGNQWYVYDINGSNQSISFINTIRDGVSSPSDSSFRPELLPPKTLNR